MTPINEESPTIESHEIAQDIHKYYDRLNDRKEFQKLVREVAEEYVLDKTIEEELPIELQNYQQSVEQGFLNPEEQTTEYNKLLAKAKTLIDKTYISDGIILKYKKRTNWHWKEEFNEELEDIGCLHLGKKITSKEESRYDIEAFKLPIEKSIRVNNKSALSKEQKEQKKRKESEMRIQDKLILKSKTIEELVLLFKQNKVEIDKMEVAYKDDRQKLLLTMTKECIDTAIADEHGLFSIKLTDKSAGYRTEEIFFSKINKNFFFLYNIRENGEVYCEDMFTRSQLTFPKKVIHDGHTLLHKNGTLYVDGIALSTPPSDEVKGLKKKDIKYIDENQLTIAIGTVPMDGVYFFRACQTSSTQVEKLIDEGKLHPNVLEDFRQIKSQDDITVHFEMIEEETKALRSYIFRQKSSRRGQQLRKDKEREQEFLSELNI